jgi:phosphate transport system permease protein
LLLIFWPIYLYIAEKNKFSIMTAKIREKIAFSILGLLTLIVIIPILFIIIYIIKNSLSVISWKFLTQPPCQGMRAGGIFPALIGTIYLMIGTCILSLPLGILSGIYLVEYAKKNIFTRIIKLAIVNLSGIPSIVYGLFGFALFVIFLKLGTSIAAGCLTLAIMSLPVIITSTKEALETVPFNYREISLSLGASKWQTIRYCVLPYALPGILTGTVLSLSRAAGETAPILFTVAAFYLPKLPNSIFDQVMALPYHLYTISTQVPNMPLNISFATAFVLILLVFIMNLISVILRTHFRKKRVW